MSKRKIVIPEGKRWGPDVAVRDDTGNLKAVRLNEEITRAIDGIRDEVMAALTREGQGAMAERTRRVLETILRQNQEQGLAPTAETLETTNLVIRKIRESLERSTCSFTIKTLLDPEDTKHLNPAFFLSPKEKKSEEINPEFLQLSDPIQPPAKNSQKFILAQLIEIVRDLHIYERGKERKAVLSCARDAALKEKSFSPEYYYYRNRNKKGAVPSSPKRAQERIARTLENFEERDFQTQFGLKIIGEGRRYQPILVGDPETHEKIIRENTLSPLSQVDAEKLERRVKERMGDLLSNSEERSRPALEAAITEVIVPCSIKGEWATFSQIAKKTKKFGRSVSKEMLQLLIIRIEEIAKNDSELIGITIRHIGYAKVALGVAEKYEPQAITRSGRIAIRASLLSEAVAPDFNFDQPTFDKQFENWACVKDLLNTKEAKVLKLLESNSARRTTTSLVELAETLHTSDTKFIYNFLARLRGLLAKSFKGTTLIKLKNGTYYLQTSKIAEEEEQKPLDTPDNRKPLHERVLAAKTKHFSSFREKDLDAFFAVALAKSQAKLSFTSEDLRAQGLQDITIMHLLKHIRGLHSEFPCLLGFTIIEPYHNHYSLVSINPYIPPLTPYTGSNNSPYPIKATSPSGKDKDLIECTVKKLRTRIEKKGKSLGGLKYTAALRGLFVLDILKAFSVEGLAIPNALIKEILKANGESPEKIRTTYTIVVANSLLSQYPYLTRKIKLVKHTKNTWILVVKNAEISDEKTTQSAEETLEASAITRRLLTIAEYRRSVANKAAFKRRLRKLQAKQLGLPERAGEQEGELDEEIDEKPDEEPGEEPDEESTAASSFTSFND